MYRLDKIEKTIQDSVRKFSLDNILLAAHRAIKGQNESSTYKISDEAGRIEPFVAAGICSFAIRFSNVYRHADKQLTLLDFNQLYDLVLGYLTTDPITTDEESANVFYNSNPVFLILRIIASQFPFKVNTFGSTGQPLLLFGELPNIIRDKEGVPKFDFYEAFQKLTGLSIHDFLSGCFVTWSAALSQNTSGITREYFEKARRQGIKILNDEGILMLLESISADPESFRKKYEEMKQADRRFRIYDFNPLLTYPLIRPWRFYQNKSMALDRMIAPLPDLVAYRASTGIFYEMFNNYKEQFSDYFGYLFEAYIGRLLEVSVTSQNLISEAALRSTYPESLGKAPDWIVLDGSTAILIESKSTRFSLKALSTGAVDSIDYSLKQVLKGLKQLYEVRQKAIAKTKGLERLHHCTEFKPLLVTFEPLYLVNSQLFRKHIDRLLSLEGIKNLPWHILSIKEFELLQTHFKAGISFADVLSKTEIMSFNEILKYVQEKTGLTYKDSFLYQKDLEMHEKLGINDL